VTEPRDGAPDDDLEETPLDDETDETEESDDGAPAEIDNEDIQDDLVDESEADVDAEVDDYDAAVQEVAGVPAAVPPRVARPGERAPRGRRRPALAAQRAPTPSEVAVHVREDWSKAFVILTVAVFTLIMLNALLLGHGGLLRPIATPSPEPTEAPSGEPSESPSAAASASPSGSAAPSVSAAPSASASASAAASAAPSSSAAPS
jgi:hypothetical protein